MSQIETPAFYDDLEATRLEAWKLLTRGVADRRSAFHTPAIATTGLDGAPRVRTVVLRAADPTQRLLRFHTDARSGKIAELARDPRVGVHVYDARHKIQVRLEGRARIHPAASPRAQEAWDSSRPQSRACYAQVASPAAPLAAPHEGDARTGDGAENFTAVEVDIHALEWLYLFHAGHRRARFTWSGEAWRGVWLAP